LAEDKQNIVSSGGLPRRWASVTGLIIILGSEFILRGAFVSKVASGYQIGIAVTVEWMIALFLLFYWIPRVEHRKLSSIGFGKFRWKYIWISIVAYIIYFLISAGLDFGLKSIGLETLRDLSPVLKSYGFPLLFGLFLTGTFVEEIYYRGYIIERVAELTGRRWLAGTISWLTFTLVHLRFFGLGPTLEVAIIAAILVLLYTSTKNIWPAIIVHGINDVFGFLIGPFFM
jgi:membrane protease YdiL (CAAX protease family)